MILQGNTYPLGATVFQEGIQFTFVSKETDCGVVLFDKKTLKEKERIPFPADYTVGDIHSMYISGMKKDCVYCFYEKDALVTDERGKAFIGIHEYGKKSRDTDILPATFVHKKYDWEGDACPLVPYEECIGYCMHVRGFTRHASSKVKHKGTFLGVVEKIPYLKELGITTLELQPAYEFEEIEGDKINYWGYTRGFYYTPKSGYAYKDAVGEFKDMVKALHKEGIEVIMQFYFPPETSKREMTDILSYWIAEYHVDGFHLKGFSIDIRMLMQEPALMNTKLWYYSFPMQQVLAQEKPNENRLAVYTDDFYYDMRRFLKGDEGMISAVMYQMRHNPVGMGRINYLTNYDGLTLYDCVSYEMKHNEENGEKNLDGASYNASWNCGAEGETRKRTVLQRRQQQMKNAVLLLFLSQGMPLIFMGDEFGNSQRGNNNPYCQDNEITWLNWKDRNSAMGKKIYAFTREVITLRKAHTVFRQKNELRMCDYIACGCPDVSYHGADAWRPDTSNESRQFGIMYCGAYATDAQNGMEPDFYVAYNMHWEERTLALPKSEKGMEWELCIGSANKEPQRTGEDTPGVILPGRSVFVYKSIGERKYVPDESRTAF